MAAVNLRVLNTETSPYKRVGKLINNVPSTSTPTATVPVNKVNIVTVKAALSSSMHSRM